MLYKTVWFSVSEHLQPIFGDVFVGEERLNDYPEGRA
jgi:hypothetical protein